MKPIIFPPNETAFQTNGLGRIDPIKCIVTEERNGQFELETVVSIDDPHFSDLEEGVILYCRHDDTSDKQPFEIYKITRPINGKVTVFAHHITYRTTKMVVMPFTADSLSGALTGLRENSVTTCPFTFWTDKLLEAKRLLKDSTGVFSNFRGNLTLPVCSMLAAKTAPERRMEAAMENYKILRDQFMPSSYLALAAFFLADMGVNGSRAQEAAERGKRIYKRMKQEHRFLTSAEDSVFAVLMSFAEQSDDQLMQDMEACYTLVKQRFSGGNAAQSVSHVLALSPGTSEEKAQKFIQLYDAIRAAGSKYGKYYQLSTLAAVSVMDANVNEIVQDMLDVDAFLSNQKGYGFLSMDRKTRMMHAAMLVTNDYCARDAALAAVMTDSISDLASQTAVISATLAIIAAQQAAMCAVIASSSAASTAVNS